MANPNLTSPDVLYADPVTVAVVVREVLPNGDVDVVIHRDTEIAVKYYVRADQFITTAGLHRGDVYQVHGVAYGADPDTDGDTLSVELLCVNRPYLVNVYRPDVTLNLPPTPPEPEEEGFWVSLPDNDGICDVFHHSIADGGPGDRRRYDLTWWSFAERRRMTWLEVVARRGHAGYRLYRHPAP